MTIDVLGTSYDIYFETLDNDNIGECERYDKAIRINTAYFDNPENNYSAIFQTIRHEVIHAFFHEAGLECYAEDEILTDALAILFLKIDVAIKRATDIIVDGIKENNEND